MENDSRKMGQSATGNNAGPDQAGRPDPEANDAMMGTSSERQKDQRKLETPGKPEKGSLADADTTP